MDGISLILTVHNQEDIIGTVFSSIMRNKSEMCKEIIIIYDGCTDNSETTIDSIECDIPKSIIYAHNVFEVIANNMGMKLSSFDYSLLIQDDMVIVEKDFDKKLMKPFLKFDNVFAVTARDAVDVELINNKINFTNVAGRDGDGTRGVFSIRDAINRGPILLRNDVVKKLNYFNEEFSPLALDDIDISMRAKKSGYVVGSYMIGYISQNNWGTTRKKSSNILEWSEEKNKQLLIKYHKDLILTPKEKISYFIGE